MDTAGTLTSVANLTGRVNDNGEVEDIDRALQQTHLQQLSARWQVLQTPHHTSKVVQALKKVAALVLQRDCCYLVSMFDFHWLNQFRFCNSASVGVHCNILLEELERH